MELPIPSHLTDFLVPQGEDNSEFEVTGKIRCLCGNEVFEVRESNGSLIVELRCKACDRNVLLFDAGKHGWDGFVCRGDHLDRELPLEKYSCENCSGDAFRIKVWISSQGKNDFLEECVAHDNTYAPEDWVDWFEWIQVSLQCAHCGQSEEDWLDCETM